jgi:hypothetical protein
VNGQMLRNIAIAFNAGMLFASPVTASAQSASAPPFTADEVRSDYLNQGFVVDAPRAWWTADQVTTLRITDRGSDRVLMVLVYPDSSMADAARSRVQALEHDNSGRLVRGFGTSAWNANVALVESTGSDLAQLYTSDQDRDSLVLADSRESPLAWGSTRVVDVDFLSALDRSTTNL